MEFERYTDRKNWYLRIIMSESKLQSSKVLKEILPNWKKDKPEVCSVFKRSKLISVRLLASRSKKTLNLSMKTDNSCKN